MDNEFVIFKLEIEKINQTLHYYHTKRNDEIQNERISRYQE